jgi:hypothetical protein
MARPEALRLLRIALRVLRMARRLLDPEVEEASFDARHLPPAVARAFTSFGMQVRYDTDPTAFGLDRTV